MPKYCIKESISRVNSANVVKRSSESFTGTGSFIFLSRILTPFSAAILPKTVFIASTICSFGLPSISKIIVISSLSMKIDEICLFKTDYSFFSEMRNIIIIKSNAKKDKINLNSFNFLDITT